MGLVSVFFQFAFNLFKFISVVRIVEVYGGCSSQTIETSSSLGASLPLCLYAHYILAVMGLLPLITFWSVPTMFHLAILPHDWYIIFCLIQANFSQYFITGFLAVFCTNSELQWNIRQWCKKVPESEQYYYFKYISALLVNIVCKPATFTLLLLIDWMMPDLYMCSVINLGTYRSIVLSSLLAFSLHRA